MSFNFLKTAHKKIKIILLIVIETPNFKNQPILLLVLQRIFFYRKILRSKISKKNKQLVTYLPPLLINQMNALIIWITKN